MHGPKSQGFIGSVFKSTHNSDMNIGQEDTSGLLPSVVKCIYSSILDTET